MSIPVALLLLAGAFTLTVTSSIVLARAWGTPLSELHDQAAPEGSG